MGITPGKPMPTSTESVGKAVSIPIDRTAEVQGYLDQISVGAATSIPPGEYYLSIQVRLVRAPDNAIVDFRGCVFKRMPGAVFPFNIMLFLGIGFEPSFIPPFQNSFGTSVPTSTGLTTFIPNAFNTSVTRGQTVIFFDTTGSNLGIGSYIILRSKNPALSYPNTGIISNKPGHELTRISNINSNSITLDAPIRITQNIEIHKFLDQSDIGRFKNVTIRGGTFIAYDGFSYLTNIKVIYGTLLDGLTLEDISVIGFAKGEGVSLTMSRYINIKRLNCGLAAGDVTSYGILLNSCGISTIQDYVYSQGRTAIVFDGGCTDISVTNAKSPLAQAPGVDAPHNYDLGHGMRNQYLSLSNTVGGRLSYGNPSWPGGENFGSVNNCTFSELISVYGPAENLTVTGHHPDYNYTASAIFFGSNYSPNIGSTYVTGPINFTNCIFSISTAVDQANTEGRLIKLGSTWGASIIVAELPRICNINNCTISGTSGTGPGIFSTPANHGIANSTTIFNMGTCIVSFPNATGPIFIFGENSKKTNLALNNCNFSVINSSKLISIGTGCTDITIEVNNTYFNNVLITPENENDWITDYSDGGKSFYNPPD
jgi:hypothetical protein